MASSRETLHINAPELLSRRRRVGDAVITGAMWLLYTYLWAPLLSLIAWLLGFEFAYDVMVRAGGIKGLQHALVWYGLMLAGIIIVVTGWSLINRLRFGKKDRRKAGAVVSDKELANICGIGVRNLCELRDARVARLLLDETGSIVRVESNSISQRRRDLESERSQTRKPTITAGNTQLALIGKCAAKK